MAKKLHACIHEYLQINKYRLQPKTYDTYADSGNLICKLLEDKPIDKYEVEDIQSLFFILVDLGYSKSQVHQIKVLLNSTFKLQSERRVLVWNPVTYATIPANAPQKQVSALANYYLTSIIDCSIYVCVRENLNSPTDFKLINKAIHYETMYSLFDNRNIGSLLSETVFLTDRTDCDAMNLTRKTVPLSSEKFDYSGTISMADLHGTIRDVPYELRGWLGIHVSLKKEVLLRNVENKSSYSMTPNAIRLYVRGKLAVENLMNYIGSNQAFANYIEGDLSFNVLDDDNCEDSSTASREGYTLSDPRVKKLIEIVDKICSSLLQERSRIGTQINKEYEQYRDSIEKAERQLREQAEEKRKVVEEEKEQAENQLHKTTIDLGSEKRRSTFLKNSLSEDQLTYSIKITYGKNK